MSSSYLRCGHCRGFYELALSECRFCGKNVPVKGADGGEKVFADRQTCRAIQIAEFEQLPKEAHDDPFRPDPAVLDKNCYCMHCGDEKEYFEAVEMRWMVNEQMWACPCTTCGGRGFNFDVHIAEDLWQCGECEHWYAPPTDKKMSNAKCPKCGSHLASGWFNDEYEEGAGEEGGGETVDLGPDALPLGIELPPMEGMRPTDAVEFVEFESGGEEEDDDEDADWWKGKGEVVSDAGPDGELKMPDDIDYPRERKSKESGGELKDDDIPW